MLGARDEVGEGVLFLEELAGVIPLSTKFLTAAYVRDRVDEPPVEEAQSGRAKISIDANAVGAVSVEQEGRRSIHRRVDV